MTKQVKLELVKDKTGITVWNENTGTICYFDEDEQSRQQFIHYLLDEFINKEVEDGMKYK